MEYFKTMQLIEVGLYCAAIFFGLLTIFLYRKGRLKPRFVTLMMFGRFICEQDTNERKQLVISQANKAAKIIVGIYKREGIDGVLLDTHTFLRMEGFNPHHVNTIDRILHDQYINNKSQFVCDLKSLVK